MTHVVILQKLQILWLLRNNPTMDLLLPKKNNDYISLLSFY